MNAKEIHSDNSTSTEKKAWSLPPDNNDIFNENSDALEAYALKIGEIYKNLTKKL